MDEKLTRENILKLLPKLRKKYKVSPEYLADKLGVTAFSIYNWETKRRIPKQPYIDKLNSIFNGFRLNVKRKKK